jgi:hypothetical protein
MRACAGWADVLVCRVSALARAASLVLHWSHQLPMSFFILVSLSQETVPLEVDLKYLSEVEADNE